MASLEMLLAELTCGVEARAEAAVVELGRLGPAAWPALESLVDAADAEARWWAVRTLAQSGPAAAASFMKALQDVSAEVRQAAALALSAFPCEQAAPLLLQALSDTDSLVPQLSANALLAIGQPVTPLVLDAWQDAPAAARIQMMRVLSGLRDPRAIPTMLNAVQGDSAVVQHWAELGLEQLGLDMVYIKLG